MEGSLESADTGALLFLLGASWPVFIGVTVVVFGGAAMLMGQALAATWRPAWQNIVYGGLLGLADRFFIFALFGGDLLLLVPFLVNSAVIMAIALLGYRVTLAHRMVAQYPWLYRRNGLFGWRDLSS
jgi:hypothetical protein